MPAFGEFTRAQLEAALREVLGQDANIGNMNPLQIFNYTKYAKDVNRIIASRLPTGRILFQDDFEDTLLKWEASGTGTIGRHTTHAMDTEACMEIVTDITANNMMEALKQIAPQESPLGKLGLEFYFSMASTKYGAFIFGLQYVSANRGVNVRSGIKLYQGEYEAAGGVWTALPDIWTGWDLSDDFRFWHHAKLIVDLVNADYIYLKVDDYEWDMEALGYKCNNLGAPMIWGMAYPYFYAMKDATGAGTYTVLVDDVIVTAEDLT